MADNFLERQRQEYEKRKAEWLRKKRHVPKKKTVVLKEENVGAVNKETIKETK